MTPLTIVAFLVALHWAVCLVNTLLNLYLLPRLSAAGAATTSPASLLSVVIPARNEALVIEKTLHAFAAQTHRQLQVIVVDDRSTDQTASIVRDFAARDSRFHLLSGVEPPEGWLGKPWALQQGGEAAQGEQILFVDADLRYDPPAIAALLEWSARSPIYQLLTVFPHVELRGFWEKILMPQLTSMVLTFLPTWLANRTHIVAFGVGGGTGNLVSASSYRQLGGHHRLKNAVVDDVGLARLFRAAGHRTGLLRADSLIHLRMYEGGEAVVEGFTKNLYMAMGGTLLHSLFALLVLLVVHLGPWLTLFVSSGHHHEPFFLLSMIALSLLLLTRAAVFHSVGYGLPYALLGHPLSMLGWCWILLRSAWRVGVRGELSWRGRSYKSRITSFGE